VRGSGCLGGKRVNMQSCQRPKQRVGRTGTATKYQTGAVGETIALTGVEGMRSEGAFMLPPLCLKAEYGPLCAIRHKVKGEGTTGCVACR
jgi:hypothetical protein